jgi:DNA-directed RNA polymerase I, II, and III subunit RPABC5
MIIPVKCFTCGNVLADKYRYFLEEVRRIKISQGLQVENVVYLTKKNMEKTPEGVVLDN